MGNLKPIDFANVRGINYDIITAEAVAGEYIEEIGHACVNPSGYAVGSIFLARDENYAMHLYKATAQITQGTGLSVGINCTISNLDSMFKSMAPQSHASTGTTYGAGDATHYGHVKVDSALSGSSINPLQNKVIKQNFDNVNEALSDLGLQVIDGYLCCVTEQ